MCGIINNTDFVYKRLNNVEEIFLFIHIYIYIFIQQFSYFTYFQFFLCTSQPIGCEANKIVYESCVIIVSIRLINLIIFTDLFNYSDDEYVAHVDLFRSRFTMYNKTQICHH